MAENQRKNNNRLLFICGAAAIAIAIIIAIILAAVGNREPDPSFFKSDDTKYVISIDNFIDDEENAEEETEEAVEDYSPLRTHLVYYYSGDSITDVKIYYEYTDKEKAAAAFKISNEANEFKDAAKAETNGKYIVITNKPSTYAKLKASYIKQQIEAMESLEESTEKEAE